jgi:hypothetical protein
VASRSRWVSHPSPRARSRSSRSRAPRSSLRNASQTASPSTPSCHCPSRGSGPTAARASWRCAPPLSHDRAREAVRRFFLAVSREDLDGLRQAFADGAQQLRPGAARGEEALPAWSRRFSRLDYYPLTGSIYWSDDTIEIARLRDATLDADHFGLSATLGDDSGAIVARATIASARAGTPLFGDSLSFVLRRAGDDYLIEQLVEDFSPP